MRKIWTIAQREYNAMVATKAFLLSITLMPILMFGGIIVANRLKDVGEEDDKTIVVVDGSGGTLFDRLQLVADVYNSIDENTVASANPGDDPPEEDDAGMSGSYILKRFPADSLTDPERLALSDQIRAGELDAFLEIPAETIDESLDAKHEVRFYAQNAAISPERRWLDRALNDAVAARRLEALGIDPAVVKQASAGVRVVPLGLLKQATDGSIRGAGEDQNMFGLFMPLGFMMLMFMVIFLSAQPMLESVLEEKAARIAEVLLGSTNPFQLMLGKLLGNAAGSLTVVALYGVGGYCAAAYNDLTDFIPWRLVPWFLVYQILAVFLFSSIFMAVGAAVSQLKDAQSLLLPVWLLLCCPMFVWLQIVREPNGPIATYLSFFPPATAMVMVLRLGAEAVIPLWQPVVGLLVLVATTLACVFLAGRVFRIGILWQGQTPRVGELFRWALRG